MGKNDLVIRPIRPEDRERIVGALDYTSPDTYYRRFHSHKRAFSDRELTYLTEVDGNEHFALIATERERPERLVAIARFVREAPGAPEAELAITVHDPYQGRGIGREMLGRLADSAREHGIERLRAIVQPENTAMIELMRDVLPRSEVDRRSPTAVELVAEL